MIISLFVHTDSILPICRGTVRTSTVPASTVNSNCQLPGFRFSLLSSYFGLMICLPNLLQICFASSFQGLQNKFNWHELNPSSSGSIFLTFPTHQSLKFDFWTFQPVLMNQSGSAAQSGSALNRSGSLKDLFKFKWLLHNFEFRRVERVARAKGRPNEVK